MIPDFFGLLKRGEALPPPRSRRGRDYRPISLAALPSAKVELYTAFRRSRMTKSELARRIGLAKPNVDRLFDLDRATRLDQIEAALNAIGKRLEIRVADAAA
ncbi:MAG TPA: hypothetical protein VFW83_04795 [Bryobacteraceae bacterium]|nr:hypothetical protein [Bryobacteraceae bacterium]